MHFLDRASVNVPQCLSQFDYRIQRWEDFRGDCKRQLRAALVEMQGIPNITTPDASEYGVRCAYCECAVHHEGHIEHFRRKNPQHFPELTFEWRNLFLACGSHDHCGHFKDYRTTGSYDPRDLIKPDEHDPAKYLYFHSTGDVRVRAGLLDEKDKHRARETIRVFGLNDAPLCGARANAVFKYKQLILDDLDELESWPPQDRDEYLQGEVDVTRWEPYATTIKHFLQKFL